MLEITDSHVYEMGNGDPGYVVPGHVDKQEMLDAIHRYEVEGGQINEGDDYSFTLHDVEHRYRVPAPKEEAEKHGCEAWYYLPAIEEPGSEPVTVCQP